ncbi:MAG: hypothetical protein KAG43_00130, partial [Candidatus Marithrix sp.]|nr:hypothetical protein [Candidatus Marithrix sp.]
MLLKQNNQFKELEIDNVTNLSYLGLIKVTGADAQQFLQGQFTNDITQVDATHHQLSAWCNHKGRIIVSLRIFQRNGYFYLLLPQESITSVLKRLKMYVLRSVVKLDDVSNDLIRIGISGTYSKKIVTDCLFTPPPEIDTSVTENA